MGNLSVSSQMSRPWRQPVTRRVASDFRWTRNIATILMLIFFGPAGGLAEEPNGENASRSESALPSEPSVTNDSDPPIRVLILTGDQHPAHDWRKTTQALQDVLSTDKRFMVRVLEHPELLPREIGKVDVIIQNYGPWSKPDPGEEMHLALQRLVAGGSGLVLIHYANGTFQDWPEYRGKISRRYWIKDQSAHDPYQEFQVVIRDTSHPVTTGLSSFPTTDELYNRQGGKEPIHVLAVGRSVETRKEEPLAFVYKYGEGRVFQTLLGHDAPAILSTGTAELIRRGTAWAAKRPPVTESAPARERE